MYGSSSKFPSGSGRSSDSSKYLSTKYVHFTNDIPPGFRPNEVDHGQEDSNDESEDGGYCRYYRRVGAVKSKPGMGGECDTIRVKKVANSSGSDEERKNLQETVQVFRKRLQEILVKEEDVKRADCKAWEELCKEGKIIKNSKPMIGEVPGIKVGDEFNYRVELMIVGLHGKFEHGIDHVWSDDYNKEVATCIVANEGHLDKLHTPDVLIYVGEGGKSRCSKTGVVNDQQLKGGNLALCNSMEVKNPVRVVKGFKRNKRMKYIYDGLYEVVAYENKGGPQRNMIFEFKIQRCRE